MFSRSALEGNSGANPTSLSVVITPTLVRLGLRYILVLPKRLPAAGAAKPSPQRSNGAQSLQPPRKLAFLGSNLKLVSPSRKL